MIDIEYIKTAGDDSFADYVRLNTNSLLYSTPRYMTLIAKHLNAQPGWLIAKRENKMVGMLPFIKKNGDLGPVFNSLAYYGSNGGVVQNKKDDEAKATLIRSFYTMANEEKAASATIITNPLEQDSDFYFKNAQYDHIDKRIGQITHFPKFITPDDLITLFKDPRPRNIRKALREGIVIEPHQDNETLEFLYTTHVANMKSIGGIEKKRDFFYSIPQIMNKSDWVIYLAKLSNKSVAALLIFYFNKTIEYFTPVVLEEYRNTQALSLIIYKAMQDAIIRGFSNWNWGGTWLTQNSVYDFKKRWGTIDYPYYYFIKLFNTTLIKQTKEEILKKYPGFYVLPFTIIEAI